MAGYTTLEREEYLTKLERQIQALDRILKMDSGTVVSAELRKQLKNLKAEADDIADTSNRTSNSGCYRIEDA